MLTYYDMIQHADGFFVTIYPNLIAIKLNFHHFTIPKFSLTVTLCRQNEVHYE